MKLEQMNIYILTVKESDYKVFKSKFKCFKNIIIVKKDFENFIDEHKNVECIVSPANSYGFMDGGYDAAISNYLGWDFQEKVQKYIKKEFYGIQPVGTSFIINAPMSKKLIHTPTMMIPQIITDCNVIYFSMRSTLICALKNKVKSIVIPPFGAGTGGVDIEDVAELMLNAYNQLLDAEKGIYIEYF